MEMQTLSTTLKEVKQLLCMESAIDPKDEEIHIDKLSSLDSASSGSVSFCGKRMKEKLNSCQASVIILTPALAQQYQGEAKVLHHKNPELAFSILLESFFSEAQPRDQAKVHVTAVCHAGAKIAESAQIGANAVIEDGAIIEDGVSIGPGCYVGSNTVIKRQAILHANATIYRNCVIGQGCIIHSGACIGVDGFGYVETDKGWKKITHIGRVVLGDNVEIGANTCIDRGMLDDTEIHQGTKIDNLCHIAHNVIIGERSAMAGCSGIAGSTTVGKNFRMGGSSGLNGQITVADNVIVGGGTSIMSSIKEPGMYIGVMPAQTQKDWARSAIAIRKSGKKAKSHDG